MAFDLSDKIIAAELQRAKALEVGQPKVPGLDKSVKVSDTLRFPDYHEPLGLDRWPFLADPLLEKLRKHGRHPPLLTDMGRTKGVPNQRQTLHTGPSDRIGSHLTPTAKHLRLKAIREERFRKARVRQLMREEGLLLPKGVTMETKVKPTPKITEYTKFGKLVSRPPRKPREPMPGLYRKRIDLDTYQLPQPEAERLSSGLSESEPEMEDEEDSVIMAMKDRRKASGQEVADIKLRTRIYGAKTAEELRTSAVPKPFMEQFPYKSCQRGLQGSRKRQYVAAAKRKKVIVAEQPGPPEVTPRRPTPEQLIWRRSALIPSETTREEMRYVASKVATTALALVKMKKMHPRLGGSTEEKRLSTRRGAIIPDAKTVAEIKHIAGKQEGRTAIRIKRTLYARASKPSLRTYEEASQPSSPVRQLKWIEQNKPHVETEPEHLERYCDYLLSPESNLPLRGMAKSQIARIKAKLNPKWLTDIMLKRKVAQISDELVDNHELAEKRSVLDYILLDAAERLRANVTHLPVKFKSSIIRAPVPWRQSHIVAKQFCRHNLFITNPIILRIRVTWAKRYSSLRFVETQNLRGRGDNPLSPEGMQEKVLEQCKDAKDILLNVSNPVDHSYRVINDTNDLTMTLVLVKRQQEERSNEIMSSL